jgi:hypothetical protein
VKTETEIGSTSTPTDGFIWLIFNLESTFYSCPELRNVLGLYPGTSASAETTAVTAIKVNNTSELCRMGALGQLKLVLKAEESARTFGNLGQVHRTSFFYDLNKSIRDVARGLRDVKIKVGGTDIVYSVVPGSISEKKSKKTTPHF